MFASLRLSVLPAVVLSTIGLASPAAAISLDAVSILSQVNVFAFDELRARQDIEGRVYAGSLQVEQSAQSFQRPVQASPLDALVVEGDVTGSGYKVQTGSVNGGQVQGNTTVGGSVRNQTFEQGNQATMRVGGTISPHVNNGTKLAGQAGTPGFEDRFLDAESKQGLRDLSADLARVEGATPEIARNTLNLTLKGIAGKTTVYDLDGALFSSFGQIDLRLGDAAGIVVNVSGETISSAENFIGNGFAAAPFTVWNFFEATRVDLGANQFFGSILAPNAKVRNGSPIEGSLVAASADLFGEVHSQPFRGVLPDVAPVPLPAALPLLLAALGGMTLMARRRAR